MEWIWRPMNESLGDRAEIFAHTMYKHYSAPDGFDFEDTAWTYVPFIDDPDLDTYNAPDMASKFYDWITH